MKRLGPADYRDMPWKNGLGSTLELYRSDGADGSMLWRVSIAAVLTDGPFSAFPGYQRHIMAIDGAGMDLDGGPHGRIGVAPAFFPASFSGDWPVSARLRDGPLRDFNLIARRDAVDARLECIGLETALSLPASAATRFLYVLTGGCTINGEPFAAGEACISGPHMPLELHSSQPEPTRLALCSLSGAAAQ